MRWLRLGLAATAAATFVLAVSCREPTQIMVSITTDVACSDVGTAGGVAIRVGSAAAVDSLASSALVATDCNAGDLGTLAVVPSSADDDQVAIVVAVGSRTDPNAPAVKSVDCAPKGQTNCIVAKRVLRYIPHTSLALPIHLSLKCAGVTCPNAEETCIEGVCTSTTPECTKTNSCKDASPPPSDGGPVKDVGPADVVASDACLTMCNGKCADFMTSPDHCGQCGFSCGNGVCVNGACKLAPTPSVNVAGRCIAAAAPVVIWTDKDAAYWTHTNGSSFVASKLVGLTSPGAAASGGGFVSFVGEAAPLSIDRAYKASTPPNLGSSPADVTLPDKYLWVGRSESGVECSSYTSGNSAFVTCLGQFPKTAIVTTNMGPLAVSANHWNLILQPGTSSAVVQSGDFSGTPLPASAVAKARTLAAAPGTDQIYVAVDGTIVSINGSTPKPVYSGPEPVRGLRVDSKGVLYFVEGPATNAAIRRLSYSGIPVPQNGAPVVWSGPLDLLGEVACIDVDDTSVYFISGGAPFKVRK